MVSKKNKGKGKAGSEPKEKPKNKKTSKKVVEESVEVADEMGSAAEEEATTDGDKCGDDHPASAGTTTEKGKTRGKQGSVQMHKVLMKKAVNKGKVGSEPKEKPKNKRSSKKATEESVEVVEEVGSAAEEEAIADVDNCGDDHPASTGTAIVMGNTRGKRGSVQMYKVLVKKALNKKIKVEYNRSGIPCGKTRAILQSYIGMRARQMIPITIDSWPKVDMELKEKLWKDIQDTFKVAPESRSLILSSAGAKWRQFKTYLTTKEVLPYYGQKKKLRKPPKKYKFISKENWREFVKSRCTPEWLEKHKLNKERVQKRKYHHRTARAGYIGIEEKMREEEHMDTDDEIDRVILWKKAHIPKDGVVDEILNPVIEKIDELLEKKERGELEMELETRNDILTQALGNPEHSGRLRGVGGFISPKRYFGRKAITKGELLARDRERDRELIEMKKLLAESQAKSQELISKALAEFSSRLTSSHIGTPLTDARAPITPSSDNSSYEHILHNLYQKNDILHNPESGIGVNVVVEDDLLFGSPPTGQNDKMLVREVVSSHVPCPAKWAIRKSRAKPKTKSKQAHKLFGESELPRHVPKTCQLLYKHAKVTMASINMSITAELEDEVFGVPKQLIVLRENVIDLLELNWIGAGVLDAYMAYLYERICAKNETDLFAFVDSGATTAFTRASFVPYLVARLKEGKNDRIFMMPHNPGGHWILTIIWESKIFIVDSMPKPSVYKGWEKAVQSVVKQFNDETGNGDGKLPKVTHLKGAPMQPGGHECGYYVMRFMKEIIEDATLSFSTKWDGTMSRKSYCQEEIDEVRVEAAEYIESLL